MMAAYDSADLLARLRRLLQIVDDTADADATALYEVLSNGQLRIAQILANVNPDLNMREPEELVSADAGATFAVTATPLSNFELYDGYPNGVPIYPVGFKAVLGYGYILEMNGAGGATIRWPGGRTRTFSRGLWARYNGVPTEMSESVEPTLVPIDARQGIVYAAAEEFAEQGGAIDPTPYSTRLGKYLYGDRNIPGDVGLIGRVQLQGRGQGLQSSRQHIAPWHQSPDLSFPIR